VATATSSDATLHCLSASKNFGKEEIEFRIELAGPGVMLATEPRQYHAVVNLTASFAIATNFVLPDEELIPYELVVCPRDGLY
jgi:hypothetical protein